MSDTGQRRDDRDGEFHWEHLGRAAEDFARQVARDAGRFAERIERHASDLARDVGREWRRSHRHEGRRADRVEREDVRRVFADVRLVIDDVLDGVDHLLERIFPGRQTASDAPRDEAREARSWARIVANRDAACGGCGADIRAGDAAWSSEASEGIELRCLSCGDAAG